MQKVSKNKVVNSYALAWLEASVSCGLEDKVIKEIEALEKSFLEDNNLIEKLKLFQEEEDLLKETMVYLAKKMKFTEITSTTLGLVAENKRVDLLPSILEEWQKLYYEKKSIVEVDVESIIPLTLSQNKKLQQVLVKKLKKDIKMNNIINKDLLGGLRITFNGYEIDDSLLKKLEEIEKLIGGNKL